MRGKKPVAADAGAKKVVRGRGGKAAAGYGARGKATRKPETGSQGRPSKTTLKASADWPFPKAAWPDLADKDRVQTNRAGQELTQETADEREARHALLDRRMTTTEVAKRYREEMDSTPSKLRHLVKTDDLITPEPISQNGLPKRLRSAT